MQAQVIFPNDTRFLVMGVFVVAYSGEMAIAVLDSRSVVYAITPAPNPTPTPTPTPPETELYKVVSTGRLRVRVDHSTSANIVKYLNPQDEFPVEKDAVFEGNGITWRKTYPEGYWVATAQDDKVYAEKVDTSGRAG